jgi:hypothetical protein
LPSRRPPQRRRRGRPEKSGDAHGHPFLVAVRHPAERFRRRVPPPRRWPDGLADAGNGTLCPQRPAGVMLSAYRCEQQRRTDRDGPLLRSPHNCRVTILARLGVPRLVLCTASAASSLITATATAVRAWRNGDTQWSNLLLFAASGCLANKVNASFDVALEGQCRACGSGFSPGPGWLWSRSDALLRRATRHWRQPAMLHAIRRPPTAPSRAERGGRSASAGDGGTLRFAHVGAAANTSSCSWTVGRHCSAKRLRDAQLATWVRLRILALRRMALT